MLPTSAATAINEGNLQRLETFSSPPEENSAFNALLSASPIPVDVLEQIFCRIGLKALGRCCQVSKFWHIVSERNALWRNFFPLCLKEGVSIKARAIKFDLQIVNTKDDFLDFVNLFFTDLLENKHDGVLTCRFSHHPKAKLALTVQHNKTPNYRLKRNYLCTELETVDLTRDTFKMSNCHLELSMWSWDMHKKIRKTIQHHNPHIYKKSKCCVFLNL